MAKQVIVLALVFFAVLSMASAKYDSPSPAPAGIESWAEGSIGQSGEEIIGTITGGSVASDAAPVGGPVPDGVFPDLTPALAPAVGAASALEVTTVAGAVAVAGVVGSFFF